MPPDQPNQPNQSGKDKIDRLSIAVYSGEFDKVHYALVMAAGAAATNTPVTLFFTMGACRGLEKTPEGREGMEPPWRAMPVSQGGHLDGDTGGEVDDGFAEKGVATFEDLLQSCAAMGVRFMVCEMGLRAMGMTRQDLRSDIPYEEGGVVTFLDDVSPSGTTLFI